MELIKVTINDKLEEVNIGTTLKELAHQFYQEDTAAIVLAFVDDRLCELHKVVEKDCKIRFVTTSEDSGHLTYKRSATLLLLKAAYDVIGTERVRNITVLYSISKGYYMELSGIGITLDQTLLNKIKARMHALVKEDIPIIKTTISTDVAAKKFAAYHMYDKERLFKYRRVSKANLYRIGNFEDYFYGYMVPSTGCLKYFDLFLYETGFVLQLPEKSAPDIVPPFEPQQKLFKVLKQSKDWGKALNTESVGALNDLIAQGEINDLILVQEALQEKKIAEMADEIVKHQKKVVLIAGPSSSGKTTFSHRLAIQLRVHGLIPHPIPMDDYFLNRENTPKDEQGDYNFESIDAIDVKQFNIDINRLLSGDTVELPQYNFVTGKREYKGRCKSIGEHDVLILEGIHGMNESLTKDVAAENKFKIYISALTQLNIDEHNRIPSTDGRLIRRIVRDARHRGTKAQETIARWNSVRRGEEENIFPFQEEADVMFNSALIYELAVLKQYAEPLLFALPSNCEEYQEAKRLLKFMDYFIGINNDMVPNNSILREFIGNSCFYV